MIRRTVQQKGGSIEKSGKGKYDLVIIGSGLVGLTAAAFAGFEFSHKAGKILSPKSSVATMSNAVCPYYRPVRPAPQGIGMDMEQAGHLSYYEHVAHLIFNYHVFQSLLFN